MENIQVTAPAMTNKREVAIAAGLSALSIAAIALPVLPLRPWASQPAWHLCRHCYSVALSICFRSSFWPVSPPASRHRLSPTLGFLSSALSSLLLGVALYAIVTMLNGISEMNSMNAQMNRCLAGLGECASILLDGGCFSREWHGRTRPSSRRKRLPGLAWSQVSLSVTVIRSRAFP